jgi:hypothetical protein
MNRRSRPDDSPYKARARRTSSHRNWGRIAGASSETANSLQTVGRGTRTAGLNFEQRANFLRLVRTSTRHAFHDQRYRIGSGINPTGVEMIRTVGSDLATFKALEFKRGLNILMADKSPGATDRQSRNGAGKTSFVELVHFLCGAEAKANGIFRNDALISSTFDMSVDLAGQAVTVYRGGTKPSRLDLLADSSKWPVHPELDEDTGLLRTSNEDWKSILGSIWFGLPVDVEAEEAGRYQPSFRSLFSYFARRQESGGFLRPVQHAEKQQPWDQQVSLSYLLGLDWTISQKFHELKAQERVAKDLGRAARAGDLGRYFGRAADLRTRLTVSEARGARLRDQLSTFRVVPEYSS